MVRRQRPVSHRQQMQRVWNHIETRIRPQIPALMPLMEEEFCPRLLQLMEQAQEDGSNRTAFDDLVNQAVILAVMTVLSGRTTNPLNQDHVRYWTCAFRTSALEQSQEDVMAAILQDEIEAAA